MIHAETPPRSDLLFTWEKPRRLLVVLPAFVLLSFLAHATTFFLFTVVYPERVTLPPPAPTVALLTPGTPEGRAMLQWLEAEDPAVVTSATSVLQRDLFDISYRPSFLTVRTEPRRPPEQANPVQYPPAKPLLAIIRGSADSAAPEVAPLRALATTVRFTGTLSTRRLSRTAPVQLERKSAVPLQPAQFLIGVEQAGTVGYVFPQRSSGDPAIDHAAANYLSKLEFASADVPISWGFATFVWGDDAYRSRGESSEKSAPQQ